MAVNSNEDSLDVDTVDSSQNRGFGYRFGKLFDASTPHSGFYKGVVLLFILSLVTIWFWKSSSDEATSLGSTKTDALLDRNPVGQASDEVINDALHQDEDDASSARGEGETYTAVRPESGKKTIQEILQESKDAAEAKAAAEAAKLKAEEDAAKVKSFPSSSRLSLNSAGSVSSARVTTQTNAEGSQPPANPLEAFALKQIEEGVLENDDSEFASIQLVAYSPNIDADDESIPAQPTNTMSLRKARDKITANTYTNQGASQGPASDSDNKPSQERENTFLAIRAGHFSYGYTITGADTDVAVSTVVAEISGGKVDGARLIGSWQRLGNWYEDLSLTFNTMEYQGETYSVDMVAFNAERSLPAFVNEVDRHILQRWGGLLTGAVLETYQAILATDNETVIAYDANGEQIEIATSVDSDNQVREALLSEGGSRVAEKLIDLYDRPITSRVFTGQDMRILSMSPVYIKKSNDLN